QVESLQRPQVGRSRRRFGASLDLKRWGVFDRRCHISTTTVFSTEKHIRAAPRESRKAAMLCVGTDPCRRMPLRSCYAAHRRAPRGGKCGGSGSGQEWPLLPE